MCVTHLLNQFLQHDFVVAQTLAEVLCGVSDPLAVGRRRDEIPVDSFMDDSRVVP